MRHSTPWRGFRPPGGVGKLSFSPNEKLGAYVPLERFTGMFESNLSPLSSFLHVSEAMLTYVIPRVVPRGSDSGIGFWG